MKVHFQLTSLPWPRPVSPVWADGGGEGNYRQVSRAGLAPRGARTAATRPDGSTGAAGQAWFFSPLLRVGLKVRFLVQNILENIIIIPAPGSGPGGRSGSDSNDCTKWAIRAPGPRAGGRRSQSA